MQLSHGRLTNSAVEVPNCEVRRSISHFSPVSAHHLWSGKNLPCRRSHPIAIVRAPLGSEASHASCSAHNSDEGGRCRRWILSLFGLMYARRSSTKCFSAYPSCRPRLSTSPSRSGFALAGSLGSVEKLSAFLNSDLLAPAAIAWRPRAQW